MSLVALNLREFFCFMAQLVSAQYISDRFSGFLNVGQEIYENIKIVKSDIGQCTIK